MNQKYRYHAIENDLNLKNYKLIRTKRKTVGIEITNQLELVIRAPYHLSVSEIEEIIKRKTGWINKTREKLKKYNRTIYKKSFNIGESFYLKGTKLKLYSIIIGEKKIELKDNRIILSKMPSDDPRTLFINWYKGLAKDFIAERLKVYSKLTGLYPSSIRITSANKRWGSCSGKNSINFSYNLIMAPVEIIDYVIVHELIHIEEKNHSKKFWQKVEKVIPDYKARRKWLKENGHLFHI